MAESIVQVTEGSGKKLHTFNRTIGANSVEDEVIITGEPYLASYIQTTANVVGTTAASHLLQIMAGASLNVYIRRIRIYQVVAATTAAFIRFNVFRLSTAGTGGGALTPNPLDTTDSACGATCMTLPTVKGTETTNMGSSALMVIQTVPLGGPVSAPEFVYDFDRPHTKALRIPAGAANGVAVKIQDACAGSSFQVEILFSEANF